MSANTQPYHVVELSEGRRLMASVNELYWQKHYIYGLLEVDVTAAKQFIEAYKAHTGEQLSFTGYLTFCLARAVDENKLVQAFMKGSKQLIVYDEVNVMLMIEQKVGERYTLMGHVIKGANHKTYWEIHQEIRAVQSAPVPANRGMPSWLQAAMLLPWPLSGLIKGLIRLLGRIDPTIFTSSAGTVGITAVGMFSKGQSGWGLAPLEHPLALIVGGTALKPAVVENRIEPRHILNLTVMFDHDLIDGAPATSFTRRLVELIESGYGLSETDNR